LAEQRIDEARFIIPLMYGKPHLRITAPYQLGHDRGGIAIDDGATHIPLGFSQPRHGGPPEQYGSTKSNSLFWPRPRARRAVGCHCPIRSVWVSAQTARSHRRRDPMRVAR